jgi:hypothetical protein
MAGEIIRPSALVLPKMTTAERDAMAAEIGTIIYNTTTNKINFSKSATINAASWEAVTSA